jgi:hypothetical protein
LWHNIFSGKKGSYLKLKAAILEKLDWSEVKAQVKTVAPELFKVIETFNP